MLGVRVIPPLPCIFAILPKIAIIEPMSNALIAFLFSIGAAAWIFNYMQHQNGNQAKQSLYVAGGAFGLLFVAMLILLSLIHK